MKKFLSIVLTLAFIFCVFGTSFVVDAAAATYYVSDNGSDSNTGTSSNRPFKTIAKVNSLSLNSGDTVLFERGSIWRGETLVCKTGVTYDAYGTGAQPAFYGSNENYAREDYWEATATAHVYKTTFTLADDIGAIVINNGQFIAVRYIATQNIGDLYSSGMFIYNTADHYVYFRCTQGNPGAVFSDIEFIQNDCLINGDGAGNITIQNITLKYGNYGYKSTKNQTNVTLRNLNISYIGGRADSSGTRAGNGIEFYASTVSNVTVDSCVVTQCYDTAFTVQFNSQDTYYGANFSDITVSNCDFSYCYWTVELWHNPGTKDGTKTTFSNINFNNNTLSYAGYGFGSGAHFSNKDVPALRYWDDEANSATFIQNFNNDNDFTSAPDVNFTGNTFCDSRDHLFFSSYGMNFSGNTFVAGTTTKVGRNGWDSTNKSLLTAANVNTIDSTASFGTIESISNTANFYAYNVMNDGGFEKAYGDEYVLNGDFSDGKTGWLDYGAKNTIQVDPDNGNKMLRAAIQADFALQLMTLPVGTYELSFRVIAFDSDSANVVSYISLYNNTEAAFVFRDTEYALNTGSFTTVTIPFEITTAGQCTLRVGPTGLNRARWGDMFGKLFDDFSIIKTDSSTGADLSEEDGWYCTSNLAYNVSDKIKGERSLDTSTADVNGAVAVKENTPYKLGYWYKGSSDVTLDVYGGSSITSKQFNSSDWTYYEYYFTTPAGCDRLSFSLSGSCLYDEFTLSPYPGYNIYTFANGMIAAKDKRFVKGGNVELFAYSNSGYAFDTDCIARYAGGAPIDFSASGSENGYIITPTAGIALSPTFNAITSDSKTHRINYVTDGDFTNIASADLITSGTEGKWYKGNYGNPTNTIVKDDNNSENNVLCVGIDFTQQVLSVPSAGTYYLSFDARLKQSSSATSRSNIPVKFFTTTGGTTYYLEANINITKNGYIHYTYDISVPAAGSYYIRIGNRGTNDEMWLDNVKLEREITYTATLSDPYKMNYNLIYSVPQGTAGSVLKGAFSLTDATVVSTDDTLKTGDTIKLQVGGNDVWTKTISVAGDVNGDAAVDVKDYVRAKKGLCGESSLTKAQTMAAKFDDTMSPQIRLDKFVIHLLCND